MVRLYSSRLYWLGQEDEDQIAMDRPRNSGRYKGIICCLKSLCDFSRVDTGFRACFCLCIEVQSSSKDDIMQDTFGKGHYSKMRSSEFVKAITARTKERQQRDSKAEQSNENKKRTWEQARSQRWTRGGYKPVKNMQGNLKCSVKHRHYTEKRYTEMNRGENQEGH